MLGSFPNRYIEFSIPHAARASDPITEHFLADKFQANLTFRTIELLSSFGM